jgi:TonB-dependent receptor
MSKSTDARSASKINRVQTALCTSLGVSLGALMMAGGLAAPAFAQDAKPAASNNEDTVVVVTGFRGSLQTSISAKKKEDAIVDVIKSEDISQFPDLNLAESLQRIPGVAIDRDGGEGRTITVRGLNNDFVRVRLNGMEAQATTGGKDSSGGANRGRGFDFNVFAADLFNSITVRKSMSGEVEEGSLGATVDLQTARPFDYKGFTMAASYQAGYNDLAKKAGGRGSFLVSNRWADGKLGALFSVAYGANTVQEEGPNTTRWENAYSPSNIGRFGAFSTNGGTSFTTIAPCTGTGAVCNTTETNSANPALTGEAQAISRALHPRIPRYSYLVTDQKRLGMTASFQARPSADTLIGLDLMYAEFSANRDEYDLEAISFSRSGAGMPKTQIYNYQIDSEGTLVKGSFNNVDIRAEHRFDELKTTFKQYNLYIEQNITDKLKFKGLVGASTSMQANPEQTTFTWDSYDVQGYSYDFTDSRHPVFNYGKSPTNCTVDQACYWSYSPNATANATTSGGTGNGTATTTTGDASLIRIRPQSVLNKFDTVKGDFIYELNDSLTFKAGAQMKNYKFFSTELDRYTAVAATRDESASTFFSAGLNTLLGTTAGITQYSQVASVGGNTFLVPNLDLLRDTVHYDCRCTNSYGTFTVNADNSSGRANNRSASEKDVSTYVQADFHHDVFGVPVRGNIGVRVAETTQIATGLLGKGSTNVLTRIERSYTDTLPSMNVSAQPWNNIFIRFAAAKTMARPTLQSLSPGGTITTSTQTISIGNPFLNPVRSTNYDLSFEWYPDKESMFTLGLFKKDISSYIQGQVRPLTFGDTGFDVGLLAGTSPQQDATTPYTVTQPINTPGGPLTGWEINLQRPFTFLPGFLKHFGGVANYTHVSSKIQYITTSTATSVTYRTADLMNLSPESWNLTLYYANGPFEARIAEAYRASYLSILGPGSGADFQGKNATRNYDAQATWKINKNLTFVLEGINLTDAYDDRNDKYSTPQGNTGQNLLLDYSHPGRQYYAGIRYKY